MYYMDRLRGKYGGTIYKTQNFRYPLAKDRKGRYKIKSGELLRVCMTSDFFLAEADVWRTDAWRIIQSRPDVLFYLLTKRPERVSGCLPSDWGDGWENVLFNVTCENQRRADERIPLLLQLPFKHKGVMCAPLIGPIDLSPYLSDGQIEQVICGGENYDGARPCHFDWVVALSNACQMHNVSFSFIETGTYFIKNGKGYRLPGKRLQSLMAHKACVNHVGRKPTYHLTDPMGFEISKNDRYKPVYRQHCHTCGGKQICNGCGNCPTCFMEGDVL